MGKVHKSFRVDEDLAAGVVALGIEGESEAATYCRVLSAGVVALNQGNTRPGRKESEESGNQAALIESLSDHVATLKEQLAIKDRQIETLTTLADHAQQLHAMTETKALEAGTSGGETVEAEPGEGKERRSFWARLFG